MKPFGRAADVRVSLNDMQDELNNLFNRFWHAGVVTGPLDGQEWAPVIDLLDERDHYTLRAEVPGIRGDDIDVSVLGRIVTIKGRKPEAHSRSDSLTVIFAETRSGSFCREVELPQEVNAESISAAFADGVLCVTIPKADSAKPRAVRVEVKRP